MLRNFGVNLPVMLDGGQYTARYDLHDLISIAGMGFRHVRIWVEPIRLIERGASMTDQLYLRNLVLWAQRLGLQPIIDFHPWAENTEKLEREIFQNPATSPNPNPPTPNPRLPGGPSAQLPREGLQTPRRGLSEQPTVSQYLLGVKTVCKALDGLAGVMYELINETVPTVDQVDMKRWWEFNDLVAGMIPHSRRVIVGPPGYKDAMHPDRGIENMIQAYEAGKYQNLRPDRIYFAFHYYYPGEYTHAGLHGYPMRPEILTPNEEVARHLRDTISYIKRAIVGHTDLMGYMATWDRVICTEFGFPSESPHTSPQEWIQTVRNVLRKYFIGATYLHYVGPERVALAKPYFSQPDRPRTVDIANFTRYFGTALDR